MTFRQLEYIYTLAQAGSISKAAQQLYVSQPALSQQITAIEKEYGIQLFYRGISPITLTEAGKMYLNTAIQILDAKKDLEYRLSRPMTSSVHIRALPFYANQVVPEILALLREKHPEITFDLTMGRAKEIFQEGYDERVDIFVHTFDVIEKDMRLWNERQYYTEPLGTETIILCMSKKNPLVEVLGNETGESGLPVADLSKLSSSTFVISLVSDQLRTFADELCTTRGSFKPTVVRESRTFQEIFGLMKFNDYITFLPDTVIDFSHEEGSLIFYEIKGPRLTRSIVATYPANKQLTQEERLFLDTAKTFLHEKLSRFRVNGI